MWMGSFYHIIINFITIYIIMGRMMDLSNTDYGGLLAKQFSEFSMKIRKTTYS